MVNVFNKHIPGSRWADPSQGISTFLNINSDDVFGIKDNLNEFHYDQSGYCQIHLKDYMIQYVEYALDFKFKTGLGLGHQDMFLCWERTPSCGIEVDDVIGDSERLWSLLKETFLKFAGRKKVRRYQ